MKDILIGFQGLCVAQNCFKSKTALLNILAIKSEQLCNFAKTLKGCHFIVFSGEDLKNYYWFVNF